MIDRPNLYLAQNISKRILEKEQKTSSATGKKTTFQTSSQTLGMERRIGISDIDTQLNYIIRIHLNVIKSQQCSHVERSHVAMKFILNSDQDLALFRQK